MTVDFVNLVQIAFTDFDKKLLVDLYRNSSAPSNVIISGRPQIFYSRPVLPPGA